MLKIYTLFLSILLFISVSARKQVLKVGIHKEFPPYEFSVGDDIIGFNIDILNQVANLYSFDIKFIADNPSNLKRLLSSDELDIISLCFQSKENKEKFILSSPYNLVSYSIFVPLQSMIEKKSDILALEISVSSEEIYQIFKTNKNFAGRLVKCKDQNECLQAVINGDTDAAVICRLSGDHLIEKNNLNYFKTPAIDFKKMQYSFAFCDSCDSIKVLFNEGLGILHETGTYDRIYKKWFGEVHPVQQTSVEKIVFWPFYLMTVAFLVLLFVFVQQRRRYLVKKAMINKEVALRHNAEKEVFYRQDDHGKMLNLVPHIVFARTQRGVCLHANQTFADIVNQPLNKLIHNKIKEAELPPEVEKIISYNQNEQNESLIYTHTNKEGQSKSYNLQKNYYHNKLYNENVLFCFGVDITNEIIIKRDLKREKSLLGCLIDSVPDIIFYKNIKGEYTGGNKAFKQLNNFTDNSFIGKTDSELFQNSTSKQFTESDSIVLKQRKNIKITNWETLPNGKKVLFETYKVPIIDENNHIIGIAGVSRDITNIEKAKEEVKNAMQEAEKSENVKSTFLANMSYELRTPLNSIIGFSDLITDSDLTDDQREEFAELIRQSGVSLLNLLDDVIDISKIESEQIQINRQEFDINRLLLDVHQNFESTRDNVHKNSVDLIFDIPGNGEHPFIIKNDEFRLRQIISNLLKNALRQTQKGNVTFGYKIKENIIEFFVKDTGIGIPKDQQEKIFERYNYNREIANTDFAGTGLGLSIAKQLVDLMGGKMWFHSTDFEGSEFFFSFELTKDLIEKRIEKASNTGNISYDWSDKTILIAEDEENNYLFLEETLRKTGVNVIWVENGLEALNKVKEIEEIDLVLMDIKMPVMNGYEATKNIKEVRKNLPVIAQTAYAMSNERDRSIEAGCDEYLTKPIRPRNLLKKIKKFL